MEGDIKMENYIDNNNISLYSVGLFSSWCLHKPSRTLFDCGSGLSQILKYKIFVPERLCISHFHIDHTSDLLAFLGLRAKTKGANDKPLDIYYPDGDLKLKKYIDFCIDYVGQLSYEVKVFPIKEKQEIQIGKNLFLKAFKTIHTKYSLGFLIFEKTRRVRDDINPNDIKSLLDQGHNRDDLTVPAQTNLFAYTLDNCGFDYNEVMNVKEIVLDCTFLNEEDRKRNTHASLKDCMWVIDAIQCKVAYLAHISPRYNENIRIITNEKI
jgi:ribonuclease Z